MVLGIVGRKGSGKDTFSNFMLKHNDQVVIHHYADRLKEVCAQVFPVGSDCYYNPLLKESPFEASVNIDDYLGALEDLIEAPLEKQNLVASSARQLLQFVGTNYVRKLYPEYWTLYLRNYIERQYTLGKRLIVVSDVRFQNEADGVTYFPDGRLLKIVRTDLISSDGHDSEKNVEAIEAPTLYVGLDEFVLSEAMACMMAKGLAEEALSILQASKPPSCRLSYEWPELVEPKLG